MGKVFHGTFDCGHKGWVEVPLDLSAQDREDREKFLFSRDCKECHQKKRLKALAVENERTAKLAKERGYPDLTGSDKQVPWATTIRQEFIEEYRRFLAKEKRFFEEEKEGMEAEAIKRAEEYFEAIPTIFDYLIKNKIESSFWIDIRDDIDRPKNILVKHKEEVLG